MLSFAHTHTRARIARFKLDGSRRGVEMAFIRRKTKSGKMMNIVGRIWSLVHSIKFIVDIFRYVLAWAGWTINIDARDFIVWPNAILS